MNILYIDDDVTEHKFLGYYLKSEPHLEVVLKSVDTLEKAISALKAQKFDFIFLDDRFSPYTSCLETLPLLHSYINGAKVAVISSSVEASHLQSADVLGVDKVFHKADLKTLLKRDMHTLFQLSKSPASI